MIDFPFQVPQIVSFCGAAGATSLDQAMSDVGKIFRLLSGDATHVGVAPG